MKTLVKEFDDIEGKVLQMIDGHIMTEPDFICTSAVANATALSPPTQMRQQQFFVTMQQPYSIHWTEQ